MQPAASAPPKTQASNVREADASDAHADHPQTTALPPLVIAALGVVFGDIGTSPLYAIKECVEGEHAVAPTHDNIFGVLSLIVWSLIIVIAGKYLTFIMKADNKGEGGMFALLALIPPKTKQATTHISWTAALVIFGAALLYGDGVITPAISVLSAVEGLGVATSALKDWVVPLTCVILLGVFWLQKKGTAGIGRVFGPIMIVWFLALAVLGIVHIVAHPSVLEALSPAYAVKFFIAQKWRSFLVLSA